MSTQVEKAKVLKQLHRKGEPLILHNIWDAGSALAVQDSGAKVIATSSWAVAHANGYGDGEQIPLSQVLINLRQIVNTVNVPVTIDIEAAYGQSLSQIQETINQVIQMGAVGINFEDQYIGGKGIHRLEEQCQRLKAIRQQADHSGIPVFINARTDVFFNSDIPNEAKQDEVKRRMLAYAESGADGIFVPGLTNPEYIQELCKISPIPVNIMVMDNSPSLDELIHFGVARISYGPLPYIKTMNGLKIQAKEFRISGKTSMVDVKQK